MFCTLELDFCDLFVFGSPASFLSLLCDVSSTLNSQNSSPVMTRCRKVPLSSDSNQSSQQSTLVTLCSGVKSIGTIFAHNFILRFCITISWTIVWGLTASQLTFECPYTVFKNTSSNSFNIFIRTRCTEESEARESFQVLLGTFLKTCLFPSETYLRKLVTSGQQSRGHSCLSMIGEKRSLTKSSHRLLLIRRAL